MTDLLNDCNTVGWTLLPDKDVSSTTRRMYIQYSVARITMIIGMVVTFVSVIRCIFCKKHQGLPGEFLLAGKLLPQGIVDKVPR